MKESLKTLIAVGFAAVSLSVAAGTYYMNRPVDLADFSDVGEQFYPNFTDPNQATGLQVVSYQPETGKTEKFRVEVKGGNWIIPSHHDYPADAKDRLAKTAASMIGVKREALAERTKSAHKTFDLIDPLDDNASTEGRGDRVTLYQGGDAIVDFIVGKKVENSQNMYYVRRADEDRFYRADLGTLNVSAKFSDWIRKDVLEIEQSNVNDILISRYHIDELQGRVVMDGRTQLKRDEKSEPWKINDLKEQTEQVNASAVGTLLNALDHLEIVGVRPKPAGLSDGLRGDGKEITINRLVQMDMASKGVFISPQGDFVYNEGKVNVGLNNGVMFELGFGEEFSGNEFDIEVGKAPPTTEEEAEKLAQEIEGKSSEEGEDSASESENKPETLVSRYLFVTAFFDPRLLGPEPVAPEKPTEPAPTEATQTENTPAVDDEGGDSPAEAPAQPETPVKSEAQVEYEKALEDYQIQLEVYEMKKKEYDTRAQAGEERVKELNRRFADWYYVISEDSFKSLKLERQALVEARTEPLPGPELDPNHPLNQPTPQASPSTEMQPEPASDAASEEAPEASTEGLPEIVPGSSSEMAPESTVEPTPASPEATPEAVPEGTMPSDAPKEPASEMPVEANPEPSADAIGDAAADVGAEPASPAETSPEPSAESTAE